MMTQAIDMPPPPSTKPVLRVDLEAVAENVRAFRARIAGTFLAVLKADAFGHGDIARIVMANGADGIAVATLDEAVDMRERGIRGPILCWLAAANADFASAFAHDIDVAVPSTAHLRSIAIAASSSGATGRVHLHADVGMQRDGAPAREWAGLCALAADVESLGLVEVVGIMSHLSSARETGSETNAVEIAAFERAVAVARAAGVRPSHLHLAATAATLALPDAAFTGARIGAGLFGIGGTRATPLRTALSLEAPVVMTRAAEPGSRVGYGLRHTVDARTTLALLPVGFADGLPRRSSREASVLLRGRRCRIVGEISMDQTVVDVGDLPVHLGDTAVILGDARSGAPTLSEWAGWAETSEHEIAARIGIRTARIPRVVSTRP